MKDIFSEIHRTNGWHGDASVSGQGSDLEQTAVIRQKLPTLFKNLGIKSVLDIPCGDHFWGRFLLWPETYIGADIVPEIIERNRQEFPDLDWRVLDATRDQLPMVDLILCRDMLGHFSNAEVQRAIRNIKRSGAKYLMATTFPGRKDQVHEIKTGQWRPIDLDYYWGLPTPMAYFNEKCTEANGNYADKSLGLWRLQ